MATKSDKKSASPVVYRPRLKDVYLTDLRPALLSDLGLDNIHQVPQIDRIVVNVGLGRGKDDKGLQETAINTLTKVTGQRPIVTKARLSVASFKLRAGQPVGLKVTLRSDYMYEFLDRFINLVVPRFRNFRGLSRTGFDKSGNYSVGLVDQSVFPELSFEETNPAHGLQVTFVIVSQSPSASLALLEGFGFKFSKPKSASN